jgi:hypothetical protein
VDGATRKEWEGKIKARWKDTRSLGKGPPDPARHSHPDIEHVSQAKPGLRVFPDRLYVLTAVSSPVRYTSRYELYRAFERKVQEAGAVLYTVEWAFGDRDFEITEADNRPHIQLRGSYEVWNKENMLNIGISRLPHECKYLAWIDSDVTFSRPDWAQETLQQLQHYKIVQLFSQAQDLGPNFQPLPGGSFDGFMYSYKNGVPLPYKQQSSVYPYPTWSKVGDMQKWHCGYAWAARKDAISELGGLIDWAILGSADHNMAAALIGQVTSTVHGSVHPNFLKWMKIWQDRAEKKIRRNVGYVDGLLLHHWHGKKVNRGYVDRWKILVENQVDPDLDLKKDWQGLWRLVDHGDIRSQKIRDDIRKYFRQRNEDSIDV